MFVTHFGNGDEADQELVLAYVKEKAGEGAVVSITILPGMNYGHLVVQSPEQSSLVMASLMEANATMIGKRVLAFFYTTMRKEDLKKSSIVDFPDARPAYTGAIPGLFIVDDFITEQESKELLSSLDAQKWNKLLNRRVQHYGFEFKYGTNNVNAEEQMGQMPPFFDFLGPKLEQQLSNFKLDPDTGFVAEYDASEQ